METLKYDWTRFKKTPNLCYLFSKKKDINFISKYMNHLRNFKNMAANKRVDFFIIFVCINGVLVIEVLKTYVAVIY